MPMSKKDVVALVADLLMPAFLKEKDRLDRIDNWYRWNHDAPHQPQHSTREYRELSARAQTPWLGLVVTSVAQALYVEGYRQATAAEDSQPWEYGWQANGMDRRQVPVHRAALAYGLSYETVLPGTNDFEERMAVIRGHSPRRMIAVYDDPAGDDWPHFAMQADPAKVSGSTGYALRVYDEADVYFLNADSGGTSITYIENREHNVGRCPVVRFSNLLDLEGRADGEVEPYIPVAGRIDQTVFDRLVVQRFASWVVRTIAGMSASETADATGETPAQVKLRLRVEDILVAEDNDTKFGSLPASDLSGFIEASKADIMALAAVSQTPAHELLGQLANLSAEALAAARASLTSKVDERQHSFGESHEQSLRLAAWIMGDEEGARDVTSQVRWKDTEIRSLSQAADALGKLAQMLGVPVELLWEKIPGFTDQDVERAKALITEGDSVGELVALLGRQAATADTDAA